MVPTLPQPWPIIKEKEYSEAAVLPCCCNKDMVGLDLCGADVDTPVLLGDMLDSEI